MVKSKDNIVGFPAPEDNFVQAFQLEKSAIRGRVSRMGGLLDDILTPHNYPKPVEKVLSRIIITTVIMASMLKYKGIFTLQIQGDGPIGLCVCDVTSQGGVRACASFKEEAITKDHDTIKAFGKGHLAFTVDHEGAEDRYQGIVALEGDSLEDCIHHYFEQSEQIKVAVQIATQQIKGHWRGGGIILQRLPEATAKKPTEEYIEDWNRAEILLDSVQAKELTDAKLDKNTLLTRLFHEEGVRIYKSEALYKDCRCSVDRLLSFLKTLPTSELEEMAKTEEDGAIVASCEFCAKEFRFSLPFDKA